MHTDQRIHLMATLTPKYPFPSIPSTSTTTPFSTPLALSSRTSPSPQPDLRLHPTHHSPIYTTLRPLRPRSTQPTTILLRFPASPPPFPHPNPNSTLVMTPNVNNIILTCIPSDPRGPTRIQGGPLYNRTLLTALGANRGSVEYLQGVSHPPWPLSAFRCTTSSTSTRLASLYLNMADEAPRASL